MRAAIYTRVSDDPNATFRSVEEQETECRQVALREGWDVVRVFSDNDRSASRHATRERPGYRAVADFLRAGGADVLLTWESSRAQRDLDAYVRLRKLCADQGVLWSYSGRTYDMNDGHDRFTTAIGAAVAELAAEETRDRVLRAMRANAAAGTPHGKLLYGYTRVYGERGQFVEQVINEDQAAIVREAARRVARGESPHAVAIDLNSRGVPSPGGTEWDLTAVRRMVINPAYAGHRVHLPKRERERKPGTAAPIVAKATWPAIVDEKTWSRCVARFATPAQVGSHGALRWLLSGIARCAVCGATLRVQKAQRRDYPTYVCSARSCVSVRARGLDAYVWLVVTKRFARPDAAPALAPANQDDAMHAAQSEAAEKRALLQEYYDLGALGKFSPAGIAAMEARLLPEIEDAERRSREAAASPVLAEVLTEVKSAPDPARVLSGLPVAIRRNIVTMLLEVRVKPAGKGARYRDPDIDDPELARVDPARMVIDWRK